MAKHACTTPPAPMHAATQPYGRLALDGVQPDVGHEVLWVVGNTLSQTILVARSLLSSTTDKRAALLSEAAALLDVPSAVWCPTANRVSRVRLHAPCRAFPQCQCHYLREAAKGITDADRHAKKLRQQTIVIHHGLLS